TASNIFTWLLAALFKRTNSWSIILEAAALIGIIIVTAAHIAKPDLENWWAKQLHEYVTQITTHSKALANDDEEVSKAKIAKAAKASSKQKVSEESTEPDVINFVNAAKPYATGIFSASLLFTALLQLFIARWWQMAAALKEQLRPELYKIRLSSIAGITFLAAIILSYFKIALAQDMLPVLYLAFCVAGLSLVHCIMAKIKAFGWLWLTVFYIVLISSWMVYHLPLGFQLVAMAALLDVWLDWRQRINKRFS
ncbi:MAG TPA: hypothetical protein VHA13_00040, partial [Gammaproteobacteria bacterium]|nr:hypothetical protein [Gammaproteobacteria bacterium]